MVKGFICRKCKKICNSFICDCDIDPAVWDQRIRCRGNVHKNNSKRKDV